MSAIKILFSSVVLGLLMQSAFADTAETKRIPQFSNDKVKVWETIVVPGSNNNLKMHRHDHARVIVPFDSGTLKITTNKGETRELKLEQFKAQYLPKDVKGEMHSDANISDHNIRILVMEFQDKNESKPAGCDCTK